MEQLDDMGDVEIFREMRGFMKGMEEGLSDYSPKGGIFVKYIPLEGKVENYCIFVSPQYPESLKEEEAKKSLQLLLLEEPEDGNPLKEKIKGDYNSVHQFLLNYYKRAVIEIVKSKEDKVKELSLSEEAVCSFSGPVGDAIYEALRNIHRTSGKPVETMHGWFLFIIQEEEGREKERSRYIRRFSPGIHIVEDYTQISGALLGRLGAQFVRPEIIKESVTSSKEKMEGANSLTTKILLNCVEPGMVQVIVDNTKMKLDALKEMGAPNILKSVSHVADRMEFFHWIINERLSLGVEENEKHPIPVSLIWEICKAAYPDHSFMIDHCNVAIPTRDGFVFTYVPLGNETLN